jgi:hypothetical protein
MDFELSEVVMGIIKRLNFNKFYFNFFQPKKKNEKNLKSFIGVQLQKRKNFLGSLLSNSMKEIIKNVV